VLARPLLRFEDQKVGLSLTADRVGFVLCGELSTSLHALKASDDAGVGIRASVRELALFSISDTLIAIRKELALSLPDIGAHSLFDVAA